MKAMLICVCVLAVAGPLLVAGQYNGQYSGYQGQQAGPYPAQVPQGDQPQIATNYNTVDGQQRSESVDGQGNVRGQYSYVDPNGKTITLKYSAGKDGFQVEGDHLPRSPVVAPAGGPPAQAPQGQYNQYQGQQQYQQPQQYQQSQQQYQQPQQQYQQPQQLQGFPQQPQHRFGGSGAGGQVSVSQNPGAGYNYQFSFQ